MMAFRLVMVLVMVMVPISAALRLKAALHLRKICSKTMKHILDYVIEPNAKSTVLQFCWQMAVSEMPRDAQQLLTILMPDLQQGLDSGSDL
jgi:hypothetical protein